MKKILTILMLIFCLALFSCGDSSDNGNGKSADVIGDIYNDISSTATSPSINLIKEARAAEIINESSYSILTNIIDPERLADISASEWIIIETTVINDGTVDLKSLTYEIMVEFDAWLTPERWACWECFSTFDGFGESCNGVWEVYGGTLIDPQSQPILPDCNGIESETGCCHDYFCPELNCDDPSWRIEYFLPGDGLQKGNGIISSLFVDESFFGSYGNKYSDPSEMGIRSDHYARWIIRDSDGNILNQKDYVFNVVP